MDLTCSGIPQEPYDLAARRAAHDGVIHHDDGLSLNNRAHGAQLQLDRRIALFLRRLDERPSDVAVLDEALGKRDARLIGESRRCRRSRVRHRDDHITAKPGLARQNTPHLEARCMNTLSIDDRVGACKIDVLEDAGSNILPIGETVGSKCAVLHDDHLSRQHIAHEGSSVDIERAGLGGKHPAALLRPSDAKRTKALRIAHTDELVLRHDGQAECAAHLLRGLQNALLDGRLL